MGKWKKVPVEKIGFGFLKLPRFLKQEVLTPFPGELSLTFVFGLKGTKRKLRTSQESSIRQTWKGFAWAADLGEEAGVCQMLASMVWALLGRLGARGQVA